MSDVCARLPRERIVSIVLNGKRWRGRTRPRPPRRSSPTSSAFLGARGRRWPRRGYPAAVAPEALRVRPLTELDIDAITRIDERITRRYRPEVWEQRVAYYMRRDPEASQVAEVDGKVAGFMMGEVRGGEFGLDEPTGWIEFFGVDPEIRGRSLGRRLIEALLAHFRSRGAHIARTMVATRDQDIAGFLNAMDFTPAPLTALEKRL